MRRLHLIMFQLFLLFCQSIGNHLILTVDECELKFPNIKTKHQEVSSSMQQYFYFCDVPGRLEFMPLKYRKQNEKNLYFIGTKFLFNDWERCENNFQPTWIKIKNEKNLCNISTYVWTYKIYTANIPKNILKCEADIKTEYNLDERFRATSGLLVFYDRYNNDITAVQYTLLPEKPITEIITWKIYLQYFKKSDFFELPLIDDFKKEFNLLPVSLINSDQEIDSELLKLKLTALAPPKHFYYSDLGLVEANLIYTWNSLDRYLHGINQFLNIVVETRGNLRITSGTTTTTTEKRATYEDKVGHKINVPELIWKTVEHTDKDTTHGIIIVLVNSFLKVDKKICEVDVCEERKWLVQVEEAKSFVYCCDMKKKAIENLNVIILSSEDRSEFILSE